MFMHNKKLQYTVRVAEPNPVLASFMLEQFGGPQGELAAAMRYFTQGLAEDDAGRKDMLLDIATEEAGAFNARLKAEIEKIISPRPNVPPGSNWQTPHDLHTRAQFAEFGPDPLRVRGFEQGREPVGEFERVERLGAGALLRRDLFDVTEDDVDERRSLLLRPERARHAL